MGFIDIHTHILYGVDDGSQSLKMSLQMLELAIERGTTDIFLTPHFNLFVRQNTPELTKPIFKEISDAAASLPINLYLGNEMRVDSKSMKAIKNNDFNTLNNTEYLLIDFPFSLFVGDPLTKLLKIKELHDKIILAHPERHSYTRSLSLMKQFKEAGILLQVNATSLSGEHGTESEDFAHEIIRERLVDFVASDAHNLTNRPPSLQGAYQIVKNQHGEEIADNLFKKNASQLIG